MRLTRRDAVAALAAVGVTVGGGALAWDRLADDELGEEEHETLVALARTVYPSVVEGVPEFVERYTVGRARQRPAYARGIASAIATLDDYAIEFFDGEFATLDAATRDKLLRQLAVDTVDPDPDGTAPQRVRYYLVNELLYALYTTPTGGELVGIENPQGHPGGTTSYRRPPE